MIIGLLRHFKVNCPFETWMDSAAFQTWNLQYDIAEVTVKPIDLRGIQWNLCWSSDLPRAIATAKQVGVRDVTIDARLREVPMSPDVKTKRKKLTLWWMVRSRFAWKRNDPSQTEGQIATSKRITSFLDDLFQQAKPDDNILLVCHGFLMRELSKELARRGFDCEKFVHAENGCLYLMKQIMR